MGGGRRRRAGRRSWRRAPAAASTASSSPSIAARTPFGCACPTRAPDKAWRVMLDTNDDSVVDAAPPLADRVRIAGRATLVARRSRRADAAHARADGARGRIRSPKRPASPATGGTSPAGATIVSAETKLALLDALRLPAATQAQVRESLARLVAETSARRLPMTHVSRLDAPRLVPLRADPGEPAGPIDATILTEDGGALGVPRRAGRSGPHRARRRAHDPRTADRPARPAGRPPPPDRRRRRMRARRRAVRSPSRQGGAEAALRRLGAALCAEAQRRPGDRRLHHARPRRRAGGRGRRRVLRRQPAAPSVPARPRAREPLPSLGPALPRPDPHRRARPLRPARRRDQRRRARRARRPDRSRFVPRRASNIPPVWAIKRDALAARYAAFARARAARPDDSDLRRLRPLRRRRRRGVAALRDLRSDRGAARRRGLAPLAGAAARRRTRRARTCRRPRNPRRSPSPCSASGSPTASSPPRPSGRKPAGSRSASIATSRSARRLTAPRTGRAPGNWRATSPSARRPTRSRRRARSGTCRRPTRSPRRATAGAASRR